MIIWTLDGTGTIDSETLTLDGSGGSSGPIVLTPSTFYGFEDISVFFTDFATTCTFGDYEAKVILSEPGQDLLGGAIGSTQYEIEYVTNTLPGLIYGSQLTIRTISFMVLQSYPMSDGVVSRARLQT